MFWQLYCKTCSSLYYIGTNPNTRRAENAQASSTVQMFPIPLNNTIANEAQEFLVAVVVVPTNRSPCINYILLQSLDIKIDRAG